MDTNIYHYEGYTVIDTVYFKFEATFVGGWEIKNLVNLFVATSTGRGVWNKRICKKIRLLIKRREANMTYKCGHCWCDDGTVRDIANDNS
jgi:hypothetical protein